MNTLNATFVPNVLASFLIIQISCVNGSYRASDEVVFSNFIKKHMNEFIANLTDPFPAPNFGFERTDTVYNYIVSINATGRVDGVRDFKSSSTVSIGALGGSFYYRLYMFPDPWIITGNYSLAGVADSLFIVNGKGAFNQTADRVDWDGSGKFEIDSKGYATINMLSYVNHSEINTTFQGIENEEIVGPHIQLFLSQVGEHLFESMHLYIRDKIRGDMIHYLNDILQTITVDEILGRPAPTTSTIAPTSTKPITSTTTESNNENVVDVAADLAESGWMIPQTSTCGYSNIITGFYCKGFPVDISCPYEGTGFWMPPCPGVCTLKYTKEDMASFAGLRFNALYNDISSESNITIRIVDNEGEQELVFTNADGNEMEISFDSFQNITSISLSIGNNGDGLFSVLDRVTLIKN